jgi:predicted RNA-binding protein with PIN domain
VGEDVVYGPLEVRFAAHADTLLERLAAENRRRADVVLVTSDGTISAAAGIDVQHVSSQTFVHELEPTARRPAPPSGLAGKLDQATRDRLERLRRGE